jgi:hypothetical protein
MPCAGVWCVRKRLVDGSYSRYSSGQELVVLFAKETGGLMRRHTVTGAHLVKLYGTHMFSE